MRVSEFFALGRTQPELEFVDVNLDGDTRVFVDPSSLRHIDSDWGHECVALLQSFFTTVLSAIQSGDHDNARGLLASLSEPNETRLGLSRGRPRGRGMGRELARDAWGALKESQAVQSGLVQDLEDSILFIEGIGFDIISDITTNILRGPLIEFTQHVSQYYGIPLTADVISGNMWDRHRHAWVSDYRQLPVAPSGRLILVPKSIVRRSTTFDPGEYFDHYILPVLQMEELAAPSSLIQTLRNGSRRVTKKSVREKYGAGKSVSLETTLRNPDVLDRYRTAKRRPQQPPSHSEIASLTGSAEPDWDRLLAAVVSTPPGTASATQYHRAVEGLLTALFYPALDFPVREFNIHQGRKRIDIQYTNVATIGFFDWLHSTQAIPSSFVSVECKNYGAEIGNPELDQLAGRFSPLRGQVGFLCHRGFGNKSAAIQKARDTAADRRGFIIILDDDDLASLVEYRKSRPDGVAFTMLFDRFRELL